MSEQYVEEPGPPTSGLGPTSFLQVLALKDRSDCSGFAAGTMCRRPRLLVLLPSTRKKQNCKATSPFIKLVFKGKTGPRIMFTLGFYGFSVRQFPRGVVSLARTELQVHTLVSLKPDNESSSQQRPEALRGFQSSL